MQNIILDLDGTLTFDDIDIPYHEKRPRLDMISRVKEYKEMGFRIIISTARNMNSFDNSIGLINVHTLPVVLAWLKKHDIPFDEIHVGKPWCGHEGFYVDDKAIRPDEFARLSLAEVYVLISKAKNGDSL